MEGERRVSFLFSLPDPGLPHGHSTVLYSVAEQDGEATTAAMRGARAGWGSTERCCPNAAAGPWMEVEPGQSGCGKNDRPQIRGSFCGERPGDWWVGGRLSSLPPPASLPTLRIQQQPFATGLVFFFLKEIKKTVTYPATQACRAAYCTASDMCAEQQQEVDRAAMVTL